MPEFSIIIPTYNRKKFVSKTIDSALNQSEASFEVIVIDDGSTDGTKDLIGSTYSDEVKYVFQNNKERGAARNRGGTIAKGDYIYFLDSDDLLYPNHLAAASDYLSSFVDKPEWFFQEYDIQDKDQKIAISYNRSNPLQTLIEEGNFMSCHGVFLRRDVFLANQFKEDRRLSGSEDYELWLRLAAQYELHINPIVTSSLVQHDDRSVFNFKSEPLIQRKKILLESLKSNKAFMNKFGDRYRSIEENSYSYIALHLMMSGYKSRALDYLWKSLKMSPRRAFSKRTLATIKFLLK